MAAGNISENPNRRPLQLKVCGMRERENISAVLALKPDWLGFIFYPGSARFVGEELPRDILENFPAGTRKVGVFVNAGADEIKEAVKNYHLEAVQLHGEEPPEVCRGLKEAGLIVLKAFSVDEGFEFSLLEAYKGSCDYYLFDTKGKDYGGNGIRFNWDLLNAYPGATPFFLSGGIDLDHAEQIKALDLPMLKGIDINSRFEISPALKDSQKVKSFIDQVRS